MSKTQLSPQQQKQVCNRLNSLAIYLGFCLGQIVNVTPLEPTPNQKQSQNKNESTNYRKYNGEPKGVLT